jgi:GABA(A) receptor-associated protein
MSSKSFKQLHTLEKRQLEASRILQKHPNRLPCIVEMSEQSMLPVLDRHKYLVPNTITVGQFLFTVRERLKVKSDQAVFLFVDNTLPPTSALMSNVYREHKDEDGFCYFVVNGESTFGCD